MQHPLVETVGLVFPDQEQPAHVLPLIHQVTKGQKLTISQVIIAEAQGLPILHPQEVLVPVVRCVVLPAQVIEVEAVVAHKDTEAQEVQATHGVYLLLVVPVQDRAMVVQEVVHPVVVTVEEAAHQEATAEGHVLPVVLVEEDHQADHVHREVDDNCNELN